MNGLAQRMYFATPPLIQSVLLSIYGHNLNRLRLGGEFQRFSAELERSERQSKTQLKEHADERFRQLVRHCYINVPYYTALFRSLGLTDSDFNSCEDVGKLPILTKEELRNNSELFVARNLKDEPSETVSTSGSTGKTLRIRISAEGRQRNYAFFNRLKRWAGVDHGRVATFAGRPIVHPAQQDPPFWRRNWAANTTLFSSYHLAPRNIQFYLRELQSWQPVLVDSYPSSIGFVANHALNTAVKLSGIKAVITSSETLADNTRQSIETVFQCRVFDQYGSAEQVVFASQCEHSTYHLAPEYGYTELLPSDSTGAFRIIATGFTNWLMPLLRYDTGDLAELGPETCLCGRNFAALGRILGRNDEMILTPDGRAVGRLDPVFKGLTGIQKAQIEQLALDRVIVRYVPGANFLKQHLSTIEEQLSLRLGSDVRVEFECCPDIPVRAGGKFKSVIGLKRAEKSRN